MEVRNFAISIQWGKGHQYLAGTDYENINQVLSKASSLQQKLLQRHKRGAKPYVHVWEIVKSFQPQLPAKQKPVKKRKSATKNQAT